MLLKNLHSCSILVDGINWVNFFDKMASAAENAQKQSYYMLEHSIVLERVLPIEIVVVSYVYKNHNRW